MSHIPQAPFIQLLPESRAADPLQLGQIMQQLRRESETNAIVQEARSRHPLPGDVGSGLLQRAIDLSSSDPVRIDGGHALYYRRVGSNPAGRLTVDLGGRVENIVPGCVIRGHFRQAVILRGEDSATEGQAVLVVSSRPDITLEDPVEGVPAQGVARWTESQALTRAAPTLVTEGMPLAGVRGVLGMVVAPTGQTITGGSVAWWRYDPTIGAWAKSFSVQLETGVQRVAIPEERITTPYGRILLATSAVTLSGGGTTVDVYLRGAA